MEQNESASKTGMQDGLDPGYTCDHWRKSEYEGKYTKKKNTLLKISMYVALKRNSYSQSKSPCSDR